jgi:RNase P/RNase MRP subunit POP5
MKALRPASREKKRYLLLEGEDLKRNVEKAILEFIGVFGFSKTGLEFIKFKGTYAIISINREMLNQVRASLCAFSKKIEVKMVSGTLKGLKEKIG